MPELDELVARRKSVESRIRQRERELLEPYVGTRVCLTTTFLKPVPGTLEAVPDEQLPEGAVRSDLYQLVLRDETWQSLRGDLATIHAQYDAYLAQRELETAPAKEILTAIKEEYGHKLSNDALAKFVGCTPDYARKFTPSMTTPGVVREQRPQDAKIPTALREQIRRRDERCVRCQAESQLHIHHITPVSHGGDSTPDNLALLCKACHLAAHNGAWNGQPRYDTQTEFWSWATDESGE